MYRVEEALKKTGVFSHSLWEIIYVESYTQLVLAIISKRAMFSLCLQQTLSSPVVPEIKEGNFDGWLMRGGKAAPVRERAQTMETMAGWDGKQDTRSSGLSISHLSRPPSKIDGPEGRMDKAWTMDYGYKGALWGLAQGTKVGQARWDEM